MNQHRKRRKLARQLCTDQFISLLLGAQPSSPPYVTRVFLTETKALFRLRVFRRCKQKQKNDSIAKTCNKPIASTTRTILSAIDSLVKENEEVGSISNRKKKDGSLRLENRRFTYAELISITDDFERNIGKGRFGVVYHGSAKDGTQVADKMLPQSSSLGSLESRTEASVLCAS
ncbi:hypothetical protein AAC387_Pa03g4460 [Persea americana]